MSLTARHEPYRVPRDEVERRLVGLRAAAREAGLALVWVEHLADRLYYSGSAQDGVLLVPADGEAAFHVRKSVERARREASTVVRPYPGGAALLDEVRRLAGTGGRVGLALDVTPAATALRLQRALGGAEPVDVAGIVRRARAVKSRWEIEQIRGAAAQYEAMLADVPAELRPGRAELSVSGWVEGRLRELGHGGTVRVRRPGSDIAVGVVVSGDSACHPTSFNGPVGAEGPYPPTASGAGWKRLAEGETVMLDVVTSHNGYHADTTRTFYLGRRIPEPVQRAHDACRRALERIEQRMRPGARCSEIYREVAAAVAAEGEPEGFMGFGENRVRFFGHGVGLELDELPVLADRIDLRLEPGSVLAVEPKAFLRGVGPVGVENTYVVTEQGCASLCTADEALRAI